MTICDHLKLTPTSSTTQWGQAPQVCEPSDAAAQAVGNAPASGGSSSGGCRLRGGSGQTARAIGCRQAAARRGRCESAYVACVKRKRAG